jgi:hypothetical protein
MAKVPYKYPDNAVQVVLDYLLDCERNQMKIPTVEELELKLDVDDDTLTDWADKYIEFRSAMKRLKMAQKVQLINDGAYGGREVNVPMFIFLLKANHNMVETEKRIIAGSPNEPLVIEKDGSKTIAVADQSLG